MGLIHGLFPFCEKFCVIVSETAKNNSNDNNNNDKQKQKKKPLKSWPLGLNEYKASCTRKVNRTLNARTCTQIINEQVKEGVSFQRLKN